LGGIFATAAAVAAPPDQSFYVRSPQRKLHWSESANNLSATREEKGSADAPLVLRVSLSLSLPPLI